MRSHKLFVVRLVTSWFLLALLAPAEAGFLSWLSGNGWNGPTGNGKAASASNNIFSALTNGKFSNGNVFNGGGSTVHGMWSQVSFGSVYQVTIQRQRQNDECVEKVKIGLEGSKLEKTLETKCSKAGIRRLRIEEDLLLIGHPDEDFCVFTTNKNELYYLQGGKWKKGDFSGDNTKDTELTPTEIDAVKERIRKWQEFFEESDKEIQKIIGLKMAERQRFGGERAQIWNEREKERKTHYANINEIYRLRNEERTKHMLERNNIYRKRAKEGWSAAIDQLQAAEDERHEKREQELEEMRDKEDSKFETILNDFEIKVSKAESKSEEELARLESLQAQEQKRKLEKMKENIKQGW